MQSKLQLVQLIFGICLVISYCTAKTIVRQKSEAEILYNETVFETSTTTTVSKCQSPIFNKYLAFYCQQKFKTENANNQLYKNEAKKSFEGKIGQNEIEEKDDNLSSPNDNTAYFTAVKRRIKRRAHGRASGGSRKSSGSGFNKKSGGISTRLTRAGQKRTSTKPKKGLKKRKQSTGNKGKNAESTGGSEPVLDHRGEGSFKARKRNYNTQKRKEQVKANRERTETDGLRAGPSGKPKQTFVRAASRAQARNMATRSRRPPVRDTAHRKGQWAHYHRTNSLGEREGKNSPHYGYSGDKQPPEHWELVKKLQNSKNNNNGGSAARDDFIF